MTTSRAAHGDGSPYPSGTVDLPELNETLPEFAEAVLDLVDEIPSGMVLAYGDVAELLGQGGPRQVGSVMSRYGSSVPWWRVVRASGEAPAGLADEALAHWRTEGTAMMRGVLEGRRVDMTRARWDGEARSGRDRKSQGFEADGAQAVGPDGSSPDERALTRGIGPF